MISFNLISAIVNHSVYLYRRGVKENFFLFFYLFVWKLFFLTFERECLTCFLPFFLVGVYTQHVPMLYTSRRWIGVGCHFVPYFLFLKEKENMWLLFYILDCVFPILQFLAIWNTWVWRYAALLFLTAALVLSSPVPITPPPFFLVYERSFQENLSLIFIDKYNIVV